MDSIGFTVDLFIVWIFKVFRLKNDDESNIRDFLDQKLDWVGLLEEDG